MKKALLGRCVDVFTRIHRDREQYFADSKRLSTNNNAIFKAQNEEKRNISKMLSALRKYIFDLRKVGVPKDPRLLLWDFNDPEVVHNWSCTNDSDLGGYSEATFQHSSKGTHIKPARVSS